MTAIRERSAKSPTPEAHRIGNVYYPRFGFGLGHAGSAGLEDLLAEIRDTVDAIARDSRAIGDDNGVLARLCNEGGRKVVEVTHIIDGVAFETNLIALNAAIEASRAGAGGGEITLVATEIRELVRKSAAATHEMRRLLRENVRKLEGGFRLVDEVGSTMSDIVGAVRQVTEILSEMAAVEAGSGGDPERTPTQT